MIIRHRVSVPSRLAAAGAALVFVIASCGGDNSADNSGTTAESWCDFVDESDVVDEVFDSLGDDPTQIEPGLKLVEDFVQRLEGEAPAEIAADAKVIADQIQMLIDAFAAADYELLDADLSFMSDSDLGDRIDEAGDNMDAYTERECGRSFGEGSESDTATEDVGSDTSLGVDEEADDTGEFDPAGGTLREQLIVQFESIGLTTDEATCIADNLDFGDPAVQSGDIGSMLSVFEDCGIGLDRLAELGG